ncbi:MAG: S9 family peptidase [Chlorobi bacterium]|nr:S9 family peptidase [Chlorobiota bacterium]
MKTFKHILIILLILLPGFFSFSQTREQVPPELTVEKIMQDPDKWIGTLPNSAFWSPDSRTFYFEWKKDTNGLRQLYKATIQDHKPVLVSEEEKKQIIPLTGIYNKDHNKELYTRNGDVFLFDLRTMKTEQLTNTTIEERVLGFSIQDTAIYFLLENNVFSLSLINGKIVQLSDFRRGNKPEPQPEYTDKNAKWLHEQQLELFNVLRERKQKAEVRKKERNKEKPIRPLPVYTGKNNPSQITVSPDGKYITWLIYYRSQNTKQTEIPHFVTESGYTEIQKARTKAGTTYYTGVDLFIYNRIKDTVYQADKKNIPGLHDIPAFWKDYPERDTAGYSRGVDFSPPVWSGNGKNVYTDIFSLDYKDRWIMLLDPATGELKLLDRQHDDAWIGGPGIGWWGDASGWMPDDRHVWYQSEKTGFSHLYMADIETGKKKALTQGKFEVYHPFFSRDRKYWYFSSNEGNPGERHFYRMDLDGKHKIRFTHMAGRNDVTLSPDEKYLTIRYSFANKPWEIYLKENNPGSRAQQITHSLNPEFRAYPWKIPEFITFRARDGVKVPARIYLPEKITNGTPAVIFVHGAGYLQNAHKWWSSYFREYMFHNLLVDKGYIVLDMDYRGSAGYGRNWRTSIYRHMGGKDLDDQVDGVKFLVSKYKVNPNKIGIYGGSYGGFITLMAMFTQPGVFTAGAALRPVTDWAHYNHGYTAEILNTPVEDSLAYIRSSPIYFAEGLAGHLLICHGMVDDNVHFQDVVRLSQRLIELGKNDWELAVYPVERHGFTEPSSWTDEYKRILKLFETYLK